MGEVGRSERLDRAVSGIDIKDLKSLADEGKKQVGSSVVAIVGVTEDGKAGLVVGVTADLVGRFSAVDLVRRGAEALGGKGGGGRPDMAQAGGPDGAGAQAALDAVAAAALGGSTTAGGFPSPLSRGALTEAAKDSPPDRLSAKPPDGFGLHLV